MKILIYGGTGFIGTWLTSALAEANLVSNLGMELTVITRDIKAAASHFRNSHAVQISFLEHDFGSGPLKRKLSADYIFHGATPSRVLTGSSDLKGVIVGSVNAALHAVSCRSSFRPIPSVIHLSSGIIYGPQEMGMGFREENDFAKSSTNEYAEAKLQVEKILQNAYESGQIKYQSPRLFAFTGPLLQLDAHFAIGNFLRDGLTGQAISINGNPGTIRSYMYPADLVVSLLAVATQDKYQNINIGSDVPISMLELATLISKMTENTRIKLPTSYPEPTNYVPSVKNLRAIIPDYQFTPLEDALQKWINWIKS
ncbi:WcaG Nucleoside-diphosphate-sugar epimerases [Candidatus Nanopelagicaceae bacterium]